MPMQIVFVGAGNLATQLSQAMQRAGHRVVQVMSRTQAHAQELAEKLHCSHTTHFDEICPTAQLYVVAVSDAALPQVAEQLCASLHHRMTAEEWGSALAVHTAGSMPAGLLTLPRSGVFYPMQTFSRTRQVDFAEIPIFVESPTAQAQLEALGRQLSHRVMPLDGQQRRIVHLAAVFACNFANHTYSLSARILQEAGIPFDVMLPLIDETARKVHHMTPAQAQTGPAVRHDQNVMRAHLSLLSDPRMKEIYTLLSQDIHDKL